MVGSNVFNSKFVENWTAQEESRGDIENLYFEVSYEEEVIIKMHITHLSDIIVFFERAWLEIQERIQEEFPELQHVSSGEEGTDFYPFSEAFSSFLSLYEEKLMEKDVMLRLVWNVPGGHSGIYNLVHRLRSFENVLKTLKKYQITKSSFFVSEQTFPVCTDLTKRT